MSDSLLRRKSIVPQQQEGHGLARTLGWPHLIALGVVEGFLSVDEAAKAAHVEVQSQIDRWGEVEDSKWGFPTIFEARADSVGALSC